MPDHLSWTSHLLRAFYSQGINHIYISPGSRSTPLVLAAAVHPGFEKHVVIDERSAAFQALGTGKVTGSPALLICTSGTAAANFYPAVIEAKQAGAPMILLTADRPPYLRGTGSSQTIDQLKLYGDSVVMFHELGEPVHQKTDYNRLSLLAKQAVITSISVAGPVHINIPFRKPLEPSRESLKEEESRNREQVSGQKRSNSDPETIHIEALSNQVTEVINRSERPLIIAGPDESHRSLNHTANTLSSRLNAPVIAEPGSHINGSINFIGRFDILLNNSRLNHLLKPDLIIRIGDQPFSNTLQVFEAENRDCPMIQLLSRDTWQDSFGSADYRIILRGNKFNPENIKQKDDGWKKVWISYNVKAEKFLAEKLQETDPITDGLACYYFLKKLINNWDIITSNSFTIRDLALFSPQPGRLNSIFVNRGASGIDGILSTGIGINRATDKPTAVFIGDIALLHDSNALLSLKDLNQPLVIIVLNNNGGNIFRMLPVYGETEYYSEYFETPQQVDLSHLAQAHGLPYMLIDSKDKLANININNLKAGEKLLIECTTDPDESMKLRHSLWNADLSAF